MFTKQIARQRGLAAAVAALAIAAAMTQGQVIYPVLDPGDNTSCLVAMEPPDEETPKLSEILESVGAKVEGSDSINIEPLLWLLPENAIPEFKKGQWGVLLLGQTEEEDVFFDEISLQLVSAELDKEALWFEARVNRGFIRLKGRVEVRDQNLVVTHQAESFGWPVSPVKRSVFISELAPTTSPDGEEQFVLASTSFSCATSCECEGANGTCEEEDCNKSRGCGGGQSGGSCEWKREFGSPMPLLLSSFFALATAVHMCRRERCRQRREQVS